MEILISSRQQASGIKKKAIRRKLERVLSDLGCHDRELSVLFTDDAHISALNERYLGKKGPTNVLAFPMGEEPGSDVPSVLLGDVVISVDTARRESEALGESLEETIDRLLIHGFLHLLGHDHEKGPTEAARMEKEEKRLLARMREF